MLFNNISQNKKHYFYALTLFMSLNLMAQNNNMSEKAIISTYQGINGPWQHLEYLFMTKPQAELNRYMEYSFKGLGLAGTLFLTKVFLLDSSEGSSKNNKKNGQFKNIAVVLSAFAAGKTMYNFIESSARRSIYKTTLLNVLNNWEMYRAHFPSSLIEYFDELATKNQTKCFVLTDSLVSEVFELVTHHIEHNFESRYKKPEQKSTNPMDTFKNCTDMWKNLE